MNGIRGKIMAQAGHAYLHAFWDSEERYPDNARSYKEHSHAIKITLVVETDEEMLQLYDRYKNLCGCTKVVDCGFTVFKEPTLTCVGIGPIYDEDVDNDIKQLKVLT